MLSARQAEPSPSAPQASQAQQQQQPPPPTDASQRQQATGAGAGASTAQAQSAQAHKSHLAQHRQQPIDKPIELRLLVRRREAGALIGKRGNNIKRLRETYCESASFSIPDSANGPERVVCIVARSWPRSLEPILRELAELLLQKSAQNDDQIELKMLVHSLHAGSIIGLGGQTIKRLRTESKAAIKIFEMCCPLSSERVCAIKSRPSTVVGAIKMILDVLDENPVGKQHTSRPYDALNFDLSSVHKYGGYLPDELLAGASSLRPGGRLAALNSAPILANPHSYNNHQQQPQLRQFGTKPLTPCHLLGQCDELSHQLHHNHRAQSQVANGVQVAASASCIGPNLKRVGSGAQPSEPRLAHNRFHPYASAHTAPSQQHQPPPLQLAPSYLASGTHFELLAAMQQQLARAGLATPVAASNGICAQQAGADALLAALAAACCDGYQAKLRVATAVTETVPNVAVCACAPDPRSQPGTQPISVRIASGQQQQLVNGSARHLKSMAASEAGTQDATTSMATATFSSAEQPRPQ